MSDATTNLQLSDSSSKHQMSINKDTRSSQAGIIWKYLKEK